jgi:protein O-GlcNAc transferase
MIDLNEQKKTNDLLFQQALAFQQAGQLADAEQLYRRVLQVFPNHADAHHNLGLIAMQAGHHGPSLQHFKTAFDVVPNQPQFVLAYTYALLNNGYLLDAMKIIKAARQRGLDSPEMKAAQRHVDEAITLSVSNPSPGAEEWDPLLKLHAEQKWSTLETKTSKLCDKYPKSGKVWKMLVIALEAQGKPALDTKRKAAQLAPGDLELQFNLANELHRRGSVDEVEEVLRAAVKNNPEHAQPYYNLGAFLANLNRSLDAGVNLQKALLLNPNYIEALCTLAMLVHNSGQLEESRQFCQRAMAVKTNSTEAICALGATLFNLGQIEEAAKQFNRALEINPNLVDAMIDLGNALRMLGLTEDAKKCFYRAIQVQPNAAYAHNNLGLILQEENEVENAIVCYQRAIALIPNYSIAYMNLGILLLKQSRFGDALECFTHCLRIQPNLAQAHCNLGSALEGLGQLEQALQSNEQALIYEPGYAYAYKNISGILVKLGKHGEAQAALDKAHSLDPTIPNVLQS